MGGGIQQDGGSQVHQPVWMEGPTATGATEMPYSCTLYTAVAVAHIEVSLSRQQMDTGRLVPSVYVSRWVSRRLVFRKC